MSPRAVTPPPAGAPRWLVVVALLSLGAGFWLLVTPGLDGTRTSAGADGYSRSAIGHHGLLQLLRDDGEVVLQSRVPRDPGPCGLFVVAEPDAVARGDDERLRTTIDEVASALVVLPKRRGELDLAAPGWVASVELLPLGEVADTLKSVGEWADARMPRVLRVDAAATDWTRARAWPAPDLPGPLQLFANVDAIEPLIACEHGVLLGLVGELFVLSDPDLIANHGLGRGDNAALVLAVLRHLKSDGAIVFDETVHGHRLEPSVWHLVGTFPFVLVPVHLLLVLAALAWTARGRFGAVAVVVPPIAAGKRFLIDNVADLLRAVGGPGPSLRRYGRQRLRRVAEALRAPAGLSDAQLRAFVLARLPDTARERVAHLLDRHAATAPVAPGDAVAMARELRSLTEGLLHAGSRDR